jgi:hypothetical protein
LRSQLASFQLHAKYAVTPNIFVIGGFRYLRLTENLDVALIDATSASDNHTHNLRVRNDLYGGELGVAYHREVWPRVHFKLIGTGGAFLNNTRGTRRLFTNDAAGFAAGTQIDERRTQNVFSFVGEVKVALSYEVISHLHVFAGYGVLFITGAGLATNYVVYDINQTTGFPAQNVSIGRSTAIYHGGFIGVKLVW